MNLNDFVTECHATSREHGFWDYPEGTDQRLLLTQKLALIHSEVSEALEELRKEEWKMSAVCKGYSEFSEELADVAIRIFDLLGDNDQDAEELILAKMHYNKTRPRKHGKRF